MDEQLKGGLDLIATRLKRDDGFCDVRWFHDGDWIWFVYSYEGRDQWGERIHEAFFENTTLETMGYAYMLLSNTRERIPIEEIPRQ